MSEEYDFWKHGIDRERDCLLRNKAWNLVKEETGMHVLPSKYIFQVKNNAPKARLVVLGCKELFGVHHNQTVAPVVKFTTVRVLRLRFMNLNKLLGSGMLRFTIVLNCNSNEYDLCLYIRQEQNDILVIAL